MAGNAGRRPTAGAQRFFGKTTALRFFSIRTAEREGAFFLPYLRPGMRLLDGGCGPGTITVGLAAAVAPGEVVGVDREAGALEQAWAHATEHGVTNVRFEQADLDAVPFPDAAFDAAFLHAVLEHAPNPLATVRLLQRVIRPGGVIGVRSPDIETYCLYPPDPVLEASLALFARLRERSGGHARIGRSLRAVLREAGLRAVVAGMSMESFGTLEGTRAWANVITGYFGDPAVADQAISLGLGDPEALGRMNAAWHAWAERPDALLGWPWGEAVGWVEGAAAP